jgi:hypothetical protein
MGRVASKDFAKAQPFGANFNEIMPDDYDRITGSSAAIVALPVSKSKKPDFPD